MNELIQYTYRKYVTMQDEQETVVEGILDEFGRVNHDAHLSLQWLQVLATVFTPMRFPAHALQMTQAYLGQIAPSSYITNCTAFAAADLLRQVSLGRRMERGGALVRSPPRCSGDGQS